MFQVQVQMEFLTFQKGFKFGISGEIISDSVGSAGETISDSVGSAGETISDSDGSGRNNFSFSNIAFFRN